MKRFNNTWLILIDNTTYHNLNEETLNLVLQWTHDIIWSTKVLILTWKYYWRDYCMPTWLTLEYSFVIFIQYPLTNCDILQGNSALKSAKFSLCPRFPWYIIINYINYNLHLLYQRVQSGMHRLFFKKRVCINKFVTL